MLTQWKHSHIYKHEASICINKNHLYIILCNLIKFNWTCHVVCRTRLRQPLGVSVLHSLRARLENNYVGCQLGYKSDGAGSSLVSGSGRTKRKIQLDNSLHLSCSGIIWCKGSTKSSEIALDKGEFSQYLSQLFPQRNIDWTLANLENFWHRDIPLLESLTKHLYHVSTSKGASIACISIKSFLQWMGANPSPQSQWQREQDQLPSFSSLTGSYHACFFPQDENEVQIHYACITFTPMDIRVMVCQSQFLVEKCSRMACFKRDRTLIVHQTTHCIGNGRQ